MPKYLVQASDTRRMVVEQARIRGLVLVAQVAPVVQTGGNHLPGGGRGEQLHLAHLNGVAGALLGRQERDGAPLHDALEHVV